MERSQLELSFVLLVLFIVSDTLLTRSAAYGQIVSGQVTPRPPVPQLSSTEENPSNNRSSRGSNNNSNNNDPVATGVIGNQAGVSIDALNVVRSLTVTSRAPDLDQLRRAAAMARNPPTERIIPQELQKVSLPPLEAAATAAVENLSARRSLRESNE